MNPIAHKLKTIRKVHNLTTHEAAVLLGYVSGEIVLTIERGVKMPGKEKLKIIERLYDELTPDEQATVKASDRVFHRTRHRGSPNYLKGLMVALDLTPTPMAALLGVRYGSVRAWLDYEQPIPDDICRALVGLGRYLQENNTLPPDAQERLTRYYDYNRQRAREQTRQNNPDAPVQQVARQRRLRRWLVAAGIVVGVASLLIPLVAHGQPQGVTWGQVKVAPAGKLPAGYGGVRYLPRENPEWKPTPLTDAMRIDAYSAQLGRVAFTFEEHANDFLYIAHLVRKTTADRDLNATLDTLAVAHGWHHALIAPRHFRYMRHLLVQLWLREGAPWWGLE